MYLIVTGAYSITPYLVFLQNNYSEIDTTPDAFSEQLFREA